MPVAKYLANIKTQTLKCDAQLKSRTLVCNLYTKSIKKKMSFPLVNSI